jgi:uncharacterized membrane protein YraQ (UPF0718 family)
VTLSFLITSPLVNEVAIVLLLGLFGWKITLLYIAGGMAIAIVRRAVAALELDADIDKVTDPGEIASWGVMATPALVIDGQVVVAGRVPDEHDLTELLIGR